MKHRTIIVVTTLTVALLFAAGCAPSATTLPPSVSSPAPSLATVPPMAQGKDAEAVLRAITDALNNKDVDAATALLADDVTQTLIPAPSGTGIYNGKDALRARFKEVVAANPVHKFSSCQPNGDQVTCMATYSDDSTKPLGFDLEFKVDAVAQNGLLKSVTWAMTDQSLAKMQAAMAPQPTPTFEPPVLASKLDDLVGVWLVQFIEGSGQGHLTFKSDGTYTIVGISGPSKGVTVDSAKFEFESAHGKLTWGNSNDNCLNAQGDKAVSCIAVYQVYVIKQSGKIVRLKFMAEDDQVWDRRTTFSGKLVTLVEP